MDIVNGALMATPGVGISRKRAHTVELVEESELVLRRRSVRTYENTSQGASFRMRTPRIRHTTADRGNLVVPGILGRPLPVR